MPTLQFVLDFLQENFENVKIRGNQITARCALCGDSARSKRKRRFNLKYLDKDSCYHCWNCGESGSFYKLYGLIKNIDPSDAFKECESVGSLFDNLSFNKKSVLVKDPPPEQNFNWIREDCFDENSIVDGYIEKQYVQALKDFKSRRRVPDNINLLVAHRGEYKGRIIIPVYDKNNNILYFQGRRIIDSIQPKYLNPTFPKEYIIPNLDFFDKAHPIILTEGLLDCYAVGHQGTSCLGKEIDDDFIKRLIAVKVPYIVIALDNDLDGKKSTIKFIDKSKYSRLVKYFLMPPQYKNVKDISELHSILSDSNIDTYTEIINNSVYYTKIISVLKSEGYYEVNRSRC